jgi:glycerophosphoryl diester phosphodiesterase
MSKIYLAEVTLQYCYSTDCFFRDYHMIVIGHRGANKEALENSWTAYDLAIQGGATRLELDVHMTKDGHVVVNHDLTLLKTTGKNLWVQNLTRDEINQVKLKNGESIPFLDEVLDRLLKRVEINIEIKGNSVELASAVASIVKAHKDYERIIVSCFSAEPLVYFADHMPDVARACLWGDWPRWPFFSMHSPLVMMNTCRASIFHPVTYWVDENLMDQAQARGWKVFPYVEMVGEDYDKEGLWAEMYALGVDGLCTNYPREFRTWLDQIQHDQKNLSDIVTSYAK